MIYHSKSMFRVFTFFVLLASLFGSTVTSTSARGVDPIIVNTADDELNFDGDCSLREAIQTANTDFAVGGCTAGAGADTIIVLAGTYTLTITGASENANATGDLDIIGALTINGAGAGTTIIQAGPTAGSGIDRVFDVLGAIPVSISGVTIANGDCSGGNGGGISNVGALTVTNSTLISNSAQVGGGISNVGALTVTNSTLSGNYGSLGGGINNDGNLTVTNSTLSGNLASYGAGIYNNSGTLNMTNSTLSGNIAGFGGGIANNTSGTLTVTNSTLSGNSASLGGGILNIGTLIVTNSTFSGNDVSTNGGGIYNNVGTLTVNNSILANSTNGTSGTDDCYLNSGTVSGTNNLIELDGSGGNACGTTAPINSDPSLGVLTGSPAYFPLNSGSPAIDAGDDAICAAAPVNNTSQNGVTRPQGTHCDIGSFEFPTLTLRSVAANDGFVLESTETSGVGGTLDAVAVTFNLGDDAADKQYRAILHFNTSSLPDTAVITKATLKIKKQGQVGTNPFTLLGGLRVDMRTPSFGAVALAIGDFQAVAGRTSVATFGVTPVSNWYSAVLNGSGRNYVNKTGATQFRLLFATDDNNDNGADHMLFHSGNAPAASRPQLIIEYTVP